MCTPPTQTLAYYAANADEFAAGTADVDFSATQQRFASLLPPNARVLDLGCGSGRDARWFLEAGFEVTATDGSPELAAIAQQVAGIPVRVELFGDLSDASAYDGVWACSSILHLPKDELTDVMRYSSSGHSSPAARSTPPSSTATSRVCATDVTSPTSRNPRSARSSKKCAASRSWTSGCRATSDPGAETSAGSTSS